jgi:hypothetical protein
MDRTNICKNIIQSIKDYIMDPVKLELDVYEYLKYLLTEMPNNHHLEDPSVIDSLLPWAKELPEQCHLKRNRKKCLKH